jgi:hypothetical protein
VGFVPVKLVWKADSETFGRIEMVGYDNIQFTKASNVLRGMGLTHLTKNENAKKDWPGAAVILMLLVTLATRRFAGTRAADVRVGQRSDPL